MGHDGQGEADDVGEAAGAASNPATLTFDRFTHPDPADRARAWKAATSVSMETAFEAGDLDGLAGSVHVLPLGPFLLADMSLTAGTFLRRRETRAKWEHDHVILDSVVTGRMEGSVGAKSVSLEAGDCITIDLKSGMRLRLDGLRFIALVMPRTLLRARVGTTAALGSVVFQAGTAEARILGSLLASLAEEARRLRPPAALALAQAAQDVLVGCLAASTAQRQEHRARKPTLAQMRRFIDRHAAQVDFGPEALCASFGLSRAALYRMFAPAGGVAEAIRRRRAALAVRLLSRAHGPSARIADIARESGFSSDRSMRNALRDLYAASPRDVMRDGTASMVDKPAPTPDFGRLFDEL